MLDLAIPRAIATQRARGAAVKVVVAKQEFSDGYRCAGVKAHKYDLLASGEGCVSNETGCQRYAQSRRDGLVLESVRKSKEENRVMAKKMAETIVSGCGGWDG